MPPDKKHWLDRPENVARLYRGLWAAGIALVALDFAVEKHEELTFTAAFGFYAVFGFMACVALVLAAKALRRVLMRPEDYYERDR